MKGSFWSEAEEDAVDNARDCDWECDLDCDCDCDCDMEADLEEEEDADQVVKVVGVELLLVKLLFAFIIDSNMMKE